MGVEFVFEVFYGGIGYGWGDIVLMGGSGEVVVVGGIDEDGKVF